MGILGRVKKFVDIVVDDDNNRTETECLQENNEFTTVNTMPIYDTPTTSDAETPTTSDAETLNLSDSDSEVVTPKPRNNEEEEEEKAEEGEENRTLESERIENEINTRKLRSTAIRELVVTNQDKAVEKMMNKHDHKRNKATRDFKVGDHVSVKKDKIDKGSSELSRVPCVIIREAHNKFELLTEFGILDNMRRADDLEPYNGLIELDVDELKEKGEFVSLRTVAINLGNRNKAINQIEIECNCTGKCKDGRCSCAKANVKCNSHCHSKKPDKIKCENR